MPGLSAQRHQCCPSPAGSVPEAGLVPGYSSSVLEGLLFGKHLGTEGNHKKEQYKGENIAFHRTKAASNTAALGPQKPPPMAKACFTISKS